jgi:hypothetical protein
VGDPSNRGVPEKLHVDEPGYRKKVWSRAVKKVGLSIRGVFVGPLMVTSMREINEDRMLNIPNCFKIWFYAANPDIWSKSA